MNELSYQQARNNRAAVGQVYVAESGGRAPQAGTGFDRNASLLTRTAFMHADFAPAGPCMSGPNLCPTALSHGARSFPCCTKTCHAVSHHAVQATCWARRGCPNMPSSPRWLEPPPQT